jgi:hypothetical protein
MTDTKCNSKNHQSNCQWILPIEKNAASKNKPKIKHIPGLTAGVSTCFLSMRKKKIEV